MSGTAISPWNRLREEMSTASSNPEQKDKQCSRKEDKMPSGLS